jgi:ribosomal protein S18 acetylase RimI-like enzyme
MSALKKSTEGKEEKYIIRDYRDGDFAGIMQLWVSTGMGNPQRGDNEQTVEESLKIGGRLLVMEDTLNSKICGTSWMTFDGRRIHLHHFGILFEYQRKGLARKLLEKSLGFVREKGCQVKLEVHSSNKRAIKLYLENGFEYLGDYDVYIIRDLSKI